MKKLFILMSAAIVAFSCAKELEAPQAPVQGGEYKIITFDVTATKTAVDGEGNVTWEEGDEISIYYLRNDGTVADPVIATADAAGAKVSFTAQIPVEDEPEAYYAAYPKATGLLTVIDNIPSFAINVNAGLCDGTFKNANFAAAYSSAEDMSFQFKNAVGVLKLTLPDGGAIIREKDGSVYPITGISVRGKSVSPVMNGRIPVEINEGVVKFGTVTNKDENDKTIGYGNATTDNLSAEAISSGVIYLPSTPVEWTDGICVNYRSDKQYLPAVLSKNAVKIERGHILPIADLSSKVILDYYVSESGSGDGLSVAAPMSISDMQTLLKSVNDMKYAYTTLRLNGATFNFTEGTHNITSTIKVWAGAADYRVCFDGDSKAVLQGSNVKVFDIYENATISNLTIQGTDVSSLSGAEANGAAVTVNTATKVRLENCTLQNNKSKSGGAVFVAYSNTATDDDSTLDCLNCKFITNTATGQGGALLVTSNATKGGAIRFHGCYFNANTSNTTENNLKEAGAVMTNGAILAMFNKCSFYQNISGKGARDIYSVSASSRLALNNCTFRNDKGGTSRGQGSSVTTKGLAVIANTSFWGNVGAWGHVALGSTTQGGSLVVNSLLCNKTASMPGLYLAASYYQDVKYSIYTAYGENESDGTSDDKTLFDVSYNLGLGKAPASASWVNYSDATPYYAVKWAWNEAYPCPTLKQVRDAIRENPIGETFLAWLDTIEGSLTTDIAGRPRNAQAMCPGSYQQEGVTPNNNWTDEAALRVMSFNISREDLGGSSNTWGKRKSAVLNMLNVHTPAVIGLQECSWTTRQDILVSKSALKAVGVSVFGTESGYTTESSNTIIYDGDLLEVQSSGTFWLSNTPDEVSETWGQWSEVKPKPRTCTWAEFKMKNSSARSFYVFNAHLESDANKTDRDNAVKCILDQVAEINQKNLPVIITGDHNDKESDLSGYNGSGFISARSSASATDKGATLNGWGKEYGSDTDTVIDHVYTKNCTAKEFFVDRSRYSGRDYISDHYPVICDLILN